MNKYQRLVEQNEMIIEVEENTLCVKHSLFEKLDTETTVLFIPEGCLSIGEYAFRNLPKLKAIWLPSSLVLLDKTAFSGLDEIEWIIFHNKAENKFSLHFEYDTDFDRLVDVFSTTTYSVQDNLEQLRNRLGKIKVCYALTI